MIRIVDGKRYNTKTATLLASWENGFYYNDFNYCTEDLYVTRSGAFFVHGEGGARSRYGRSYGRDLIAGEEIHPVDAGAARRFLERHGDPETTARLFAVADA